MAKLNLIGLGLLIISGGAVRLTDSGLGCPQWPSCGRTTFVGPLSLHKDVEFGNRILSTVISILVVLTVVAAWRLVSPRTDLKRVAGLVVVGVLAQIVAGGLVVKSHLWPPLVIVHFLLSEALVGVGVYLVWRIDHPYGMDNRVVDKKLVMLARGLVFSTGILVVLGSTTSGAGPHGGSRGAARLPISFRGISEAHATFAAYLVGLIVATMFACLVAGVSPEILKRARTLVVVTLAQGAIGYTQYFLHDPGYIVVFHLAGATVVIIAVLNFYLGLFSARKPVATNVPVGIQ